MKKSYSQVVKTPPRMSPVAVPSSAPPVLSEAQQKVSAPSAMPDEGEPSSSREDSTRDPLLLKIYEFMGSLNNRFERLENAVGLRSGEENPSEDSSRQEGADIVMKAFLPQQSPRKSPFKGIKAVADSRRSLKREGGVNVDLRTPKRAKSSREVDVAEGLNISGTVNELGGFFYWG